MREHIDKERIYLFSPYAITATHVEIEGIIFEEKLRECVQLAVRRNELLNARVTLDDNGEAWYETQVFDSNPNEQLRIYHNAYWKDIVSEQERVAFDLDHGELIRTFYIKNEDKQELLIIAHRLAGDGISFAFFIEDIFKAMSGQKVAAKSFCRFKHDDADNKQSLSARMKLKQQITTWKHEGAAFTEEDYYQLCTNAWKDRESYIAYETINTKQLYKIAAYAKERGVTINAVILTAFAMAAKSLRSVQVKTISDNEKPKDGKRKLFRSHSENASDGQIVNDTNFGFTPDEFSLEVSSRGDYRGVADCGVNMHFSFLYDETQDFSHNVRLLQEKIPTERSGERDLFSSMISNFPGSLIDSIYFQLQDMYESPVTQWAMEQLGIKDKPKGIAVTNMTGMSIYDKYGSILLRNYAYVPPMVPNARRIIGITMFNGVMNISFRAMKDEYLQNAKLFFQKGIAFLREI